MAYNILVADNDIQCRRIISSILVDDINTVYSVSEADNSIDAWQFVMQQQLDLVLLNMHLEASVDLLKKIRLKFKAIPVIVLVQNVDNDWSQQSHSETL